MRIDADAPLWHPMTLPDATPSTKTERVCRECGQIFVTYVYARDARCEECRKKPCGAR